MPDAITPEPGSLHNADRSLYSVFWPPKTPEQIAAFNRYVKWMVDHFHTRIHYWALWNEQDISYWNPVPNPEEYGLLLKSFVQVVHDADRDAKVIYGGQADPSRCRDCSTSGAICPKICRACVQNRGRYLGADQESTLV